MTEKAKTRTIPGAKGHQPGRKITPLELKRRYKRFLELRHKWLYEDDPEEQKETGKFFDESARPGPRIQS
jgi:hypothetical protein